jgi:hypothetical protein
LRTTFEAISTITKIFYPIGKLARFKLHKRGYAFSIGQILVLSLAYSTICPAQLPDGQGIPRLTGFLLQRRAVSQKHLQDWGLRRQKDDCGQ